MTLSAELLLLLHVVRFFYRSIDSGVFVVPRVAALPRPSFHAPAFLDLHRSSSVSCPGFPPTLFWVFPSPLMTSLLRAWAAAGDEEKWHKELP